MASSSIRTRTSGAAGVGVGKGAWPGEPRGASRHRLNGVLEAHRHTSVEPWNTEKFKS